MVEFDKLQKLIEKLFDSSFNLAGDAADWDLGSMGIVEEEDDDSGVQPDKDDQPIIAFINKMLLDAIRKGASDLHFEPYEKMYRIRFRIDGILNEVANGIFQIYLPQKKQIFCQLRSIKKILWARIPVL